MNITIENYVNQNFSREMTQKYMDGQLLRWNATSIGNIFSFVQFWTIPYDEMDIEIASEIQTLFKPGEIVRLSGLGSSLE